MEKVAITKPSGEGYKRVDQVASVIAALRDGSTVRCTGEDGLWSAAMCLKAAESVQTQAPVSLKEL